MMKSRLYVVVLFAAFQLNAQTVHHFKTGLAAPDCHRYGREAVVKDHLAYQLYTGQMEAPADGARLFTGERGTDVIWKEVKTDTTNRFRGEALSNGYIYLSYQSDRVMMAILNVSGNSMVYVNGEPRGGDIYNDGWMYLPVVLKRGNNEFLIRCGNFARWQGVSARLIFSEKPALLQTEDATLPHIVLGQPSEELTGALIVTNNTTRPIADVLITATINGKSVETKIPVIPAVSGRKVAFNFDGSAAKEKGDYTCIVELKQGKKTVDKKSITISAVPSDEHHSYTFISEIDGSVQYYSVAPRIQGAANSKPALFLSVHGAGVQAIGQARAYQPKDWGVLVAPTNRRPRGFNWEDWGRIDALEVLNLATKRFNPDPERIYLTGHSMGGHGTWYLGATYPDKWAAIAPCAGYPTLTGYGSADGRIPEQGQTEAEKILLRASNASNVVDLARNYRDLGIYIHHGDSDKVVSVNFARQMRKVLGEFHGDFSYFEYPGGSHWFGSESVDWPPLFEYFKWHKIEHDTTADVIDFVTANPAISSSNRWGSIIQQGQSLAYSKFHLVRNRKRMSVTGSTENVAAIRISLHAFRTGDVISISLDSSKLQHTVSESREVILGGYPNWQVTSEINARHKNTARTGTFKEAFNHRMVFVYGTKGTPEENAWAYHKAKYDAETWYYRGNGAVDVVADKIFSPQDFRDRGVIIYGNSVTNQAWKKLLKNCPINVTSDRITVGSASFDGKDLAAYFAWPREDSDKAMTAVIAGTGLTGMQAADANQYFAAGSGFPDYLIFSIDMLRNGSKAIKAAGFFNNQFKISDNPVVNE